MKIVQSFWSKPGLSDTKINCCGWPQKQYNYFSWQFSALQFCKFYEEVELITDQYGYDLLINKFQIPYTNVKVILDELNDYHPKLFVVGKLLAYQRQDKPFIHADGDVFIWERLPKNLESAGLICQHKEAGNDYNKWYSNVFVEMASKLDYIPAAIWNSLDRHNSVIESVNAGIIGGNDIDFFTRYSNEAFSFINENISRLDEINIFPANTVFEQFLFNAMAEGENRTIEFFKNDYNFFWKDFVDFTGLPTQVKYIHPPGKVKHERRVCDSLEFNFKSNYAPYYQRTVDLLKKHYV